MSDPYLIPHSIVLRNKFGLRDQPALDEREANAVIVRSLLLQLNPVSGNFDCEHLKKIHEYLFQDVYEWAGQFRTVPLAKAEQLEGGRVIRFTPPEQIENELASVFQRLADESYLRNLQRKQFSQKAAALFAEINRAHPFREGNGRAQRQFVRQLAGGVGYKLHFEVVSKERLIQASIESACGDCSMMERLFDEITDTERIQSLQKVIIHLKNSNFSWNDIYIATTTSGQAYKGTFAGTDGVNFFFRDEDERILVGTLKDLPEIPSPGDKITFTAS